jgi:hypothetical protein
MESQFEFQKDLSDRRPVLEARLKKSNVTIWYLCIFASLPFSVSFKQVSVLQTSIFFSLFLYFLLTIHTIEFINSLHSTTVSNKAFILVLLNISSWKEKTSVLTSWRKKSTLSIDAQKLFVLSVRQVGMRKGTRRNVIVIVIVIVILYFTCWSVLFTYPLFIHLLASQSLSLTHTYTRTLYLSS